MPIIPDATSKNWKKIIETYIPFFAVFRKYRGELVTGDTGISSQFAADPYRCIDMVTYMGGSIPLAMGAYLGGKRNVWAVTGDFSFIAAGPLALLETRLRKIPLKIVILDNGKAATTGGQPIAPEALAWCVEPYEQYVRRISDPGNARLLESILSEAAACAELRIIVLNYRE